MLNFNPVLPGEFREMLTRVSPAGLQLGIALAFFMNSDGRCWPSSETLVEMTGLCKWTLVQARKELLEYGLTWKRRRRKSAVYEWDIFKKVDMSTFGESCQVGCHVENQEVCTTPPLEIKKCEIAPLRSVTGHTSSIMNMNNTKEQREKKILSPKFGNRQSGNGNGDKFKPFTDRFETPADRSALIRRACGIKEDAV